MTNVHTILVPVDFSDASIAALRHACEFARVFRSHIHLLHVSAGSNAPRWATEMFATELRPVEAQHRLEVLDKLATLIVSHHLDPFSTTGLVRTGCAADVIATYANEVHADLIVMGLPGDRVTPTPHVGQTVQRVLGAVRCPVLTIPEERAPVKSLTASWGATAPLPC